METKRQRDRESDLKNICLTEGHRTTSNYLKVKRSKFTKFPYVHAQCCIDYNSLNPTKVSFPTRFDLILFDFFLPVFHQSEKF